MLFSLALFFLLLVSINILLYPDMPGYFGVHPHPYLIAILLMAGRYGRRAGYLAAFVAAAILLVYLYLETSPFFNWSKLSSEEFIAPLLSFFLAALFVGEMRHAALRRENALQTRNAELKRENRRLKEQLEVVIQIKEELENRLLGQQDTINSLYQAAKALETLEENEFYQALTRMTARFTGATKVSFYLIDYPNDQIRCVARFGWEDTEENVPFTQKLGEGIFALVLKENRILTIKEISENPDQLELWEKSPEKAYVYTPISMGSVIIGILTVDEVPFLKLNISTVRTLSLIAELAVPALKNIIHYQDLQNMVQIDPVTGLAKYTAFLEDAEIEFKKAARYHLDFALLHFQIDGLDTVEKQYGHPAVVETLKWFAQHLKPMLRSMDILANGEHPGEFYLALPITDSEGMLEVIERISAWFEDTRRQFEWGSDLQLHYGAVAYHPTIKSLEHMLRLVKHSLRINKISKAKQLS